MQDLIMKDQMQGPENGRPKKDEISENAAPENAGPQKHDRKLDDKLPKAITQCN